MNVSKKLFSDLSRRTTTETKVKTFAEEQKEPEKGTEGVTYGSLYCQLLLILPQVL